MHSIPTNEIAFEPSSSVDRTGRLFRWNGGVYRAIREERAGFVRELLEKKNIEALFDKGLVKTQAAPFSLEGFSFVLEHYRVPFVTYAGEWTAQMLKDAALMTCDLSAELHARGLNLYDAHPWNVLFDGGRPVFVDWGSIRPASEDPEWPYKEFRAWFLLPLWLMAAGQAPLARTMFLDVANRPAARTIVPMVLSRAPSVALLTFIVYDRMLRKTAWRADKAFFARLRRAIEAIPVKAAVTEWTGYEGVDKLYTHEAPDQWNAKIRNVHKLLAQLEPATALDIGCNRGWFSELAAKQGAQVVAGDVDEPSLNAVYQHARASRTSVLPVILDLCATTPAHGVAQAYPAMHERLRAEFVLNLAVTHHLVFKRSMDFDAIARQLAGFTKKWLLVEFVPGGDVHVKPWLTEQHGWYTQENFSAALRRHFARIEVFESTPAPRILLLCER
jgi:SAM-dependent methyltransferase